MKRIRNIYLVELYRRYERAAVRAEKAYNASVEDTKETGVSREYLLAQKEMWRTEDALAKGLEMALCGLLTKQEVRRCIQRRPAAVYGLIHSLTE